DRAHLAGGEVEDLAAILGEQEAPGGMVDDLPGERARAGVADQVPVGVGPESVVGGKRGGGRSGHGSDVTSGSGDPSISPSWPPCPAGPNEMTEQVRQVILGRDYASVRAGTTWAAR